MAEEFKAVAIREGDPDLIREDRRRQERCRRWKNCWHGWRSIIIPALTMDPIF